MLLSGGKRDRNSGRVPRPFPFRKAPMTTNHTSECTHLAQIEEELRERFPHPNGISQAMRKKLALCLYKKEQCTALTSKARRAMGTAAWEQASAEKKAEYRQNLRQTEDRIGELNGLIRKYMIVLEEAERLLVKR